MVFTENFKIEVYAVNGEPETWDWVVFDAQGYWFGQFRTMEDIAQLTNEAIEDLVNASC